MSYVAFGCLSFEYVKCYWFLAIAAISEVSTNNTADSFGRLNQDCTIEIVIRL
jgi:hypothetical protein